MPTYTVTAPQGRLSEEQKGRIAAAITRIHHDVTGAPTYFAQVPFDEPPAGNGFVGGAPLAEDQVFVHGQIRGGRTAENKKKLLQVLEAVAAAAQVPKGDVWVYIVDLLPAQMAEFGRVLAEPGEEAASTAALPAADRERFAKIGR